MFTGIIIEVGKIINIDFLSETMVLTIAARKVTININLGDSICVNGVCLTVTDFSTAWFKVNVVKETLTKTNFDGITVGTKVNLEPAITLETKLGGHIVQGHVDTTGKIQKITKEKNNTIMLISYSSNLAAFLVKKGSIAVNGVSLTISNLVEVENDYNFEVALIPATLVETVLGDAKIGDEVNIETDIIGKYLIRQLALKH